MPHRCIIKGCNNYSNKTSFLSFHSLPLCKPKLLQRWLSKMKFKGNPNKHMKVCSAHFEDGKRKGDSDVPTIFPWTYQRPPPKDRSVDSLFVHNIETQAIVPKTAHGTTQTECSTQHAGIQTLISVTTNSTTQTVNITQNAGVQTHVKRFCIEDIASDSKLVHFYTGFEDFETFTLCFELLGPSVSKLCYHNKSSESMRSSAAGAPHALSPINEFFLVLCRLRLGLLIEDLAFRFKVSKATVSRIVITWINFLYFKFKEIDIWPSREQVQHYMPSVFTESYPSTRCIIDATEIYIQSPTSPVTQQLTFSNYKNHNTLKALIGITPSGVISFVSDLFGGCISDRELTIQSEFLDKLEPGDSIMADKGFLITDLLDPLGVSLNIPPMKRTNQLSEDELIETRRIASARIHVERAIGRVKNYHILTDIPNTLAGTINQIFFVCCMLTNFKRPLI